jgi:hypothetical protein
MTSVTKNLSSQESEFSKCWKLFGAVEEVMHYGTSWMF